jgi:alkanesulfonate monooxygenase SsuD/methylene tetrahydromethanopterin reductase-like flavin-dependent oxidoreductase (luciferase family)
MPDPATSGVPGHPWVTNGQQQVRFGIGGGLFEDWLVLRDFVQMVEDLGFDSYWRPDHPLFAQDCWTMLAAVAASTHRLRLGTTVSCVLYRNPLLLARIVADVDRISQGRVVLGLGAGYVEPEFRAMGLAFPPLRERQAALSEALQIIPKLLGGEAVTFHGAHFQLEGVSLLLPPVQQPYVPVLVAGGGERITLRAVARYADASNLLPSREGGGAAAVADVHRKYAVLQEHCTEIGRPYSAILRTYQFVPCILADSPAALDAKREHLPQLLRLRQDGLVGTPEQAVDRLNALVGAGCQYFILSTFDVETLQLLHDRVVPSVIAATSEAV